MTKAWKAWKAWTPAEQAEFVMAKITAQVMINALSNAMAAVRKLHAAKRALPPGSWGDLKGPALVKQARTAACEIVEAATKL